MTLEGGVIVLSILLAFAIDAWWGQRKDNIEGIEQLTRVAAELRLNSRVVRTKTENLQIAIDATAEFLSWMGPQPQQKSMEAFSHQWDTLTDIGTFSLVRRAANDYLAAGRETMSGNLNIRDSLSEWYHYSDRLENQYEILRLEHWTLHDYANRIPATPMLSTMSTNFVMSKHPGSKFPFDQAALLSDPVFESLLANYLIRVEFVLLQALEQQERQSDLLTSVDAIVAE